MSVHGIILFHQPQENISKRYVCHFKFYRSCALSLFYTFYQNMLIKKNSKVNTRIMKHTLRNILSVQSVSNSKDISLTESAVTPLDVTCMLSSYPVRMIFRFHFKWAATLKANNLKALTFLFSFMKTLTSENRESNFNTSTTYYKHFISEREQTTFSIHQGFLKYLFITWSLR